MVVQLHFSPLWARDPHFFSGRGDTLRRGVLRFSKVKQDGVAPRPRGDRIGDNQHRETAAKVTCTGRKRAFPYLIPGRWGPPPAGAAVQLSPLL